MARQSITRFNVTVGGRRTSFAIDTTLLALLTLRLGHHPGSLEGRAAVREWAARESARESGNGLSARLQRAAVLAVAEPALVAALHEHEGQG